MKGVKQHLIRVSSPSSLTFVGEEMQSGEFYAKMVKLIIKGSSQRARYTF